MYVPYISDIIRQLDEVIKIFAIEKELRSIKNRGYFPEPQITPLDSKIETACDKDKMLETVNKMAAAMLQAITESEEAYIREQNQARARDEQLRSARQTDRSGFNYFTLANSTPIRNDNARPDPPGVPFITNPICHVYSTTSDGDDQYEPPVNDPIIHLHQQTNLQPIQLERQVVMTHGDAVMVQVQPQIQQHTDCQLDQPVIMVYTTTSHQTLQKTGTTPYASDAENKAT